MKINYLLHFKRRRLGKTNYKKRLNLLLSRKKRAVIRVTNTMISSQIIDYGKNGDVTLVNANSKELKALGWKNNIKNIPSAYLTGLMLAKKAKENNIKDAVLDIGLHTPTKGSRVFAVLKGIVDGGIEVNHSESKLPSDERITGKHIDAFRKTNISKDFDAIKSKIINMPTKNKKR